MGKVLFYLLWPFIWVYAPMVRRVRVYMECDGHVLFVKNWFGPRVWQLPGGGVHFGESVMDAARREIKEELNVSLPENARITTDEVVVVQQFGLLMRYHIVHCRFATRPKLVPNREIIATKWAKSSDLLVAPEVIHAERTL